MIEKKIRYEVNIEKPSKTKPVKQGGVLNYLGKQKTVNTPIKWRSGPTHPETHLAYITKDEEKILIDLNIYKSMKNGKPNRGPFGLPSLNDGGDSGGDGGGNSGGSGGSGGSDAAGDAGNATGDSAGAAGSGGSSGPSGGSGPGGESGTGGADAGPGSPGTEDAVAENAAAVAQAIAEQTVTNPPMEEIEAAPAPVNVVEGLMGLASKAMKAYTTYSPTAIAARAIADAISAANRGVTAPDDYSQLTDSVQTSTPGPNNSGGVNTINQYAPLYNTSTGDNTADAMRARLNNLLQTQQPVVRGIPSVSPYSNYTLLDLARRGYI
jgi:hypothetical protein